MNSNRADQLCFPVSLFQTSVGKGVGEVVVAPKAVREFEASVVSSKGVVV